MQPFFDSAMKGDNDAKHKEFTGGEEFKRVRLDRHLFNFANIYDMATTVIENSHISTRVKKNEENIAKIYEILE